ncbi:MAG TPA: hypothetical protein VLC92_04950 [Rhodocyclaceae bacterium]|nr:hypothetical protein [Rhodocyclaceae bacterium]
MTDLHQPPKKSARPNLFAPKEATRIIDERISVLASLDANPPPKKKKKRGLAGSTLVVLGVTVALFAGVISLALTRPEQATNDAIAATSAPPQATSHEQTIAPVSHGATSEAPSLSLSELAASAPASATIENEAAAPARDPIAILESTNGAGAADGAPTAKPGTSTPAAPSSPLKALNATTQNKHSPKDNTGLAQSVPVAATKSSTRAASAKPAAATRSSNPKANPVDNDVTLLEGLLASANRQEAKDRAAAKGKEKPLEAVVAEPNREGSAAKPQQ